MTRTDPEITSAIDAIHPLNLGVALKLTGAMAGATRNLALILAEAVTYGANENVVACIFGFAADAKRPGEWCDFLLDAEAQPIIDTPELADAYTLATTVIGDCVDACRAERRAKADRMLRKLKHSDVPAHPRRA